MSVPGPEQLQDENFLRNLRQYALVYNELTEKCFQSCVHNLSNRKLTTEELLCADSCAAKLIQASGKVVAKVSEINPTGMGQPPLSPYR